MQHRPRSSVPSAPQGARGAQGLATRARSGDAPGSFAEQEAHLAPDGAADRATQPRHASSARAPGGAQSAREERGALAHGESALVGDAQNRVAVATAAEVVCTGVDAAHRPSFSCEVSVPFTAMLAGMRGAGITLEELRAVSALALAGGPDKDATASAAPSQRALTIRVAPLSAPTAFNACAFVVTLASGRRLHLTVDVPRFHCDVTLWERHQLETGIEETQRGIESMRGMESRAAEVLLHPPSADVGPEQAELDRELAALETTRRALIQRTALLRSGWGALTPALQRQAAETLRDPSGAATPENRVADLGRKLGGTLDRRNGPLTLLKNNRQLADALRGTRAGATMRMLQGLDATAEELRAEIARRDQEVREAQAELERALTAESALFERVLAFSEDAILAQPGRAPDTGRHLESLRSELASRASSSATLLRIIERKLAAPAVELASAHVRRDAANGELEKLRAQLARQQVELATFRGPVFVMLGRRAERLPTRVSDARTGPSAGGARAPR